jgi:predicted MFS family arabinose efflux permease
MMIVTLLFGAAFLGAILYLTQFNQQVFGASPSEAGMMLLPMMAGMMTASIGIGQIVSRTGYYKRFIVLGFALATLSVLGLVTLQSDSPYWHEAVLMVFVGLGLGMGMPIMNLAVQNEFEQKDLGAATSSVQLFRGLGSTIGTALMSSVLTTGIVASMGAPADIPYLQALKQSPAAAKMFGEGRSQPIRCSGSTPSSKQSRTVPFRLSIRYRYQLRSRTSRKLSLNHNKTTTARKLSMRLPIRFTIFS